MCCEGSESSCESELSCESGWTLGKLEGAAIRIPELPDVLANCALSAFLVDIADDLWSGAVAPEGTRIGRGDGLTRQSDLGG